MKIAILILATLAMASCQNFSAAPQPTFNDEEAPVSNFDLVTALLTGVIQSQPFQWKLQKFYDVIDLKTRFLQITGELLRRENLMLMHRILDFTSRLCNFLKQFLPEPEERRASFLESLFPVVNLNDRDDTRFERDAILESNQIEKNQDGQEKLFEKHKDDVIQVAKLIYGTQ